MEERSAANHLTRIAHRYIAAAKLGKYGACHPFRHTMATLMHGNGPDIRYIQQILSVLKAKNAFSYPDFTCPS